MATLDRDRDDASREEEELRSPPRGDQRPWLLGVLGIVLMLGGYAALNLTMPIPSQGEQARRIEELRRQSFERKAQGEDDGLYERLNPSERPHTPPSYLPLARLAIYFGAFLFVLAGVLMYRSSPPPPREDELA